MLGFFFKPRATIGIRVVFRTDRTWCCRGLEKKNDGPFLGHRSTNQRGRTGPSRGRFRADTGPPFMFSLGLGACRFRLPPPRLPLAVWAGPSRLERGHAHVDRSATLFISVDGFAKYQRRRGTPFSPNRLPRLHSFLFVFFQIK